ncbi:MAG: WXG100 family type VII secretion target [Clostridiaceae bacterium]|nr:WXG100 family type VII secretion target [Clostridiaceae bacterium]
MAGGSSSTGTVKSIDTKDFDGAIEKFKGAINIYREARERVFDSTEKLLYTWEGKGKDAFEKQYDQLKTKLKDEEDNLNTIKEDLEDCRQAYVDWDEKMTGELKASVS